MNTTTQTEKAGEAQTQVQVRLIRKGGSAGLQLVETSIPTPKADEVRVKVLAAGVAYAEVMQSYGLYPGQPKLPYTPGYDIAGVIDAIGADVSDWQIGQPVVALTIYGGYAQYICLPSTKLVGLPSTIDMAEAASLALNYVTAYQMLHHVAKMQGGQSILVHGAAGGVGTALLQLGKVAGLKMYGTASTTKQKLVLDLGATPIDYTKDDFVARVTGLNGSGVDAVFDHIGGAHLAQSFKVVGKGGILVGYGVKVSRPESTNLTKAMLTTMLPTVGRLFLWSALPNGRRATFSSINTKKYLALSKQDLTTLVALLADGHIQPIIAARLPLSQVAQALDLVEKAQVKGKVVLLPQK